MANKSYQNYQNKKNKNLSAQRNKPTTKTNLAENEKTKPNVKTETKTETNKETIKLGEVRDMSEKETHENHENFSVSKNQNKKQKEQPKSKDDKIRHAWGAIILIGTTLVVGGLASILGGKMRDGLLKPPAYPPEWLFPVMWCIFYISIGIASYLAYFSVKDKKQRTCDLVCFGIHLFFNMFWSLFYFRLNLMIFATIWLGFVVVTAIVVTFRYFKANLASGIIFTAYTLWLLFAMYLSLGITILNV